MAKISHIWSVASPDAGSGQTTFGNEFRTLVDDAFTIVYVKGLHKVWS